MALWGGRFSQGPEESMAALSRSVHFDWRLAKYDVRVNLAHLDGLVASGVIAAGNGEVIKAGLKALGNDIANNKFTFNDGDEDVHSAIERGLIEKIGSVGGSIRAGRSRNDLVVTDFKLYLIDHLLEVAEILAKLVTALNRKAVETVGIHAPGFTHLQHAQPISFGQEIAKHSQSFMRDISRISDWLERNSTSPFGAGALAGSPLQLDPESTAEALGFDSVINNSIDAVSDRDFVAEALFILATIGVHFSRIGEEYTLWNSSEFGWVVLDDKFSTGSSIMPQKKNPDIAELARGKAGRLIGNLTAMLTTMKGLAFAYNRDLQEDKEPVFDSIETLLVLLPAVIGMIETSKFQKNKIESGALAGFSLATEVADFLAQHGVPFSEAHEVSGNVVKYCEKNGKELDQLTEVELSGIDKRLTSELLKKLNSAGAINSRTSSLGTAESSVKEQLKNLTSEVTEAERWISNARKEFSGMMTL
jgi:argininosuccinate lyase